VIGFRRLDGPDGRSPRMRRPADLDELITDNSPWARSLGSAYRWRRKLGGWTSTGLRAWRKRSSRSKSGDRSTTRGDRTAPRLTPL